MKLLPAMALSAVIGSTVPANAKDSTDLKKECWQMALTAHPASLPDIPSVTNLRRSYYRLCLARGGKMDPLR
jgi:hypothetical protein